MKINTCVKWLKPTLDKCAKQYGLQIEIIQGNHIKIIFKNQLGTRWTYFTGCTPSDVRARQRQITTLRNALRNKFDIPLEKSDFTLQFYAGPYVSKI